MRPPLLRLGLDELIVDNFAGGGGASTGIEAALGRSPDIAINHDRMALAMHKANHPSTRHYCEDVWDINPVKVCKGRPVGLAWFSPDCKHFSKAKGGKPVEKKVRGLAWLAVKWAKAVRPRVIVLENVTEFQDWGPLLPNNMPDPDRKGLTFKRWLGQLRNLGYNIEWRELKASDYDTPTIRKRLFLVARRDGQPITWPEKATGPVRTAAECIDWTVPCPSIFNRKRPLAPATLRRIANGIKRFVIETQEPFIVGIDNKSNGARDVWDISEPLRTVTVENRFAVATPFLAHTNHSGSDRRSSSLGEPFKTITAAPRGEQALISPTLIQTGYGERRGQQPRVPGLHKPLGTVDAGGAKHALVAAFLAQHNTGMVGHKPEKPLSTITGRGCQQQIVTSHLTKFYGTCKDGVDLREPMPTVTASSRGGGHIAEVRAFLMQYYGDGGRQAQDLFSPMGTIRTHDSLALVTVADEEYAIVDIGMRMLTPRELFRAQGFPEDYVIERDADGNPLTKTAQVRMCGNSVCPPLARAVVEAQFGMAA